MPRLRTPGMARLKTRALLIPPMREPPDRSAPADQAAQPGVIGLVGGLPVLVTVPRKRLAAAFLRAVAAGAALRAQLALRLVTWRRARSLVRGDAFAGRLVLGAGGRKESAQRATYHVECAKNDGKREQDDILRSHRVPARHYVTVVSHEFPRRVGLMFLLWSGCHVLTPRIAALLLVFRPRETTSA
jgi:hypothetical protein